MDKHTNEKYAADLIQSIHQLTRIPVRKLEKYGEVNNLLNVLEHPLVLEPTTVQYQKIGQLNAFLRAYQVVKWNEENTRQRISSPKDAGEYFSALLRGVRDREQFMVAFLDTSNHVIETRTMSIGGIDQAVVYPRDILKAALNCDCKSIIMAHNHPGGTPNPSPEDIQLTSRMVDIFSPLHIQVLDHIIIAGNDFTSMAEKGLFPNAAENHANYTPITLNLHEAACLPEFCEGTTDLNEIEDEWER